MLHSASVIKFRHPGAAKKAINSKPEERDGLPPIRIWQGPFPTDTVSADGVGGPVRDEDIRSIFGNYGPVQRV